MDSKYIYASIIFSVGFILGYLLNYLSDDESNKVLENNLNADQGLVQASTRTNPFTPLTQQRKEIEQTHTSETIETNENIVSKQGLFTNELLSEEPSPDADIESKLATIGFLVSDDETEQLASNLGDNSTYVRKQTIIGLGDINSDEALRIVGQALMSDTSAENRIVAVSVLEKSLHLEFVESLLTHAMLNDPDILVRQSAAQTLGMEANVK